MVETIIAIVYIGVVLLPIVSVIVGIAQGKRWESHPKLFKESYSSLVLRGRR